MNLNWIKLIIHSWKITHPLVLVGWHLQNTTGLIKKIIYDLLGCVSHSVTIDHTLIFKLDPLCSHNWGFSTPNPLKAQLAAKTAHLPWPSQHSIIYQAFLPGISTSQPVLARIPPPTAGHSMGRKMPEEEGAPFRTTQTWVCEHRGSSSSSVSPGLLPVFSWITWALKQCPAFKKHLTCCSCTPVSYPQILSVLQQLSNLHSLAFCSLALKSSLIRQDKCWKIPRLLWALKEHPRCADLTCAHEESSVTVNLKHHFVSTERNGRYSTFLWIAQLQQLFKKSL